MTTETIHPIDTPPAIEALVASLERLDGMSLPPECRAIVSEARLQAGLVNAEMQSLRQSVQDTSQAHTKFVSVVTHELRLPLTSIKGYTDLLRQGIVGPVNDQQKNFLNVVRTNVDRMSALISDLSDMSHLQTGRIKLLLKPTTLQALVQTTLTPFTARFEEKSQKLEIVLPAEPVEIVVDSTRLEQVLCTLLSNANKYTQPGGKISLCAGLSGDQVRIEITDNGIGINQEDKERIFSAFFRSDDEAVREHPGWGLALHVARLLVDLMGGEIGVDSEPKKGSTFWLVFPRGV